CVVRIPTHPTVFPYTTLFRSTLFGSGAALAQGHAGDILLELDGNNRLVTSMETDGGVISNVRVFGSEFGEGGVFNFTDEPGFERSEEHTSELQSRENLVCRLL